MHFLCWFGAERDKTQHVGASVGVKWAILNTNEHKIVSFGLVSIPCRIKHIHFIAIPHIVHIYFLFSPMLLYLTNRTAPLPHMTVLGACAVILLTAILSHGRKRNDIFSVPYPKVLNIRVTG